MTSIPIPRFAARLHFSPNTISANPQDDPRDTAQDFSRPDRDSYDILASTVLGDASFQRALRMPHTEHVDVFVTRIRGHQAGTAENPKFSIQVKDSTHVDKDPRNPRHVLQGSLTFSLEDLRSGASWPASRFAEFVQQQLGKISLIRVIQEQADVLQANGLDVTSLPDIEVPGVGVSLVKTPE